VNERVVQDNGGYDANRGVWYEISPGSFDRRPALFVDRDGVLVEDTRYLGKPEHLRVLPGAAEALARCNRLGIPIVLVSNQSGIARGYYDWQGFHAVQAALAASLRKVGARLDAVFACAYHADGRAPLNIAELRAMALPRSSFFSTICITKD